MSVRRSPHAEDWSVQLSFSSWRFTVENRTTKPQPHSVSTQELNQVNSSMSLAYLAWDILCLPLEGHQCALICLAQPQQSCCPKEVRGRGPAVMAPGWVRTFWHLCLTSLSMQPEGCCQILPLAALQNCSSWLHATERHCSVKVQTEFVAKKKQLLVSSCPELESLQNK